MTKHDMIAEFVENLSDADLCDLWNESATDGDLEYIEFVDDIDELWKPSDLLSYDLSSFDITDTYYVCDYCNSLVSYQWCRELIDDVYDLNDLIDLIDVYYNGWNTELLELVDSEEYKKAV